MTKPNLLNGEFECCGVLCDKHKAQQRIDRMQDFINKANLYFNEAVPNLTELRKEAKELSDD